MGTWGKYGGQPAEREAPPRWPRGRRGESRACRGSRSRGVGVGDVELVDRLFEGEREKMKKYNDKIVRMQSNLASRNYFFVLLFHSVYGYGYERTVDTVCIDNIDY